MDLPFERDAVREALRRHGVVFALVFGSHARGEASAESDVDLGVWGPEGLDVWNLRAALPSEVDLVDLRTAPDQLVGRVAMEGRLLLDDHPPTRVRWQALRRKVHLDEEPRRARFRQDFIRAHG